MGTVLIIVAGFVAGTYMNYTRDQITALKKRVQFLEEKNGISPVSEVSGE